MPYSTFIYSCNQPTLFTIIQMKNVTFSVSSSSNLNFKAIQDSTYAILELYMISLICHPIEVDLFPIEVGRWCEMAFQVWLLLNLLVGATCHYFLVDLHGKVWVFWSLFSKLFWGLREPSKTLLMFIFKVRGESQNSHVCFQVFFLFMCAHHGSIVLPIGKLDASNFKGLSLASCGFWLRVSCAIGNLISLLQVKGAWQNPCLLVLEASLKPMIKVRGAFQNPISLDCEYMLIYCNLVLLKVMGVKIHP